jgi:hypothetical protein
MIVGRVQQGPVQIEKDGRVAWIFPGITRSASDELWMRVPAGVQQKI